MLEDQCRAPRNKFLEFVRHTRRNRFRAGEAFRERGHLRAPRRQVFLLGLRRLPQGDLLLHRLGDFLFRSLSRA